MPTRTNLARRSTTGGTERTRRLHPRQRPAAADHRPRRRAQRLPDCRRRAPLPRPPDQRRARPSARSSSSRRQRRRPHQADHRERPARRRAPAGTGDVLSGAHGPNGLDAGGTRPAHRQGRAPHHRADRPAEDRRPSTSSFSPSGNLKPSEATELARLVASAVRCVLFKAIRPARAKPTTTSAPSATALVNAEAQLTLMRLRHQPPPTEEDRRLATALRGQVDRIALMLRTGIRDNQVVAVRKVSPHRAGVLADQFGAMQKDLRRIEVALRRRRSRRVSWRDDGPPWRSSPLRQSVYGADSTSKGGSESGPKGPFWRGLSGT